MPEWMLKAIDKPALTGSKYKHLIELAIRFDGAINQCNLQLGQISSLNDNNETVNR